MRRWVTALALAVLAGCGGPDEEVASPLRLVATQDRSDVVRLEWSMGAGAVPLSLLVVRDGEIIGDLPPGSRDFEDVGADAPGLDVTDLLADSEAIGAALSWRVVEKVGSTHTYVVRAVGRGGNRDSEAAAGSRGVPGLVGFTVTRDGAAVAEVPSGETRFHDTGAAAGVAPLLRVTGTSAAVSLSWDDVAAADGKRHVYEVQARWSDGTTAKAGPLEMDARPARPEAFLVFRDGERIAEMPVESRGYEDGGATPGRLLPPGLAIRSETVQGIDLMWSARTALAGPTHRYELAVRWEGGAVSRSADAAIGGREAPVVSAFEIRRDGAVLGGVAGDASGFRDELADPGKLTPTAFQLRGTRDAVALSWAVGRGQRGRAHRYGIRAVPDAGEPSSSNEVEGSRTGPTALGFVVSRDGETIATLDAAQRDFLDTGAGPATSFAAPLLVAGLKSVTNTEGVWLRWTEPTGQGVVHRYELRALTEIGPGEPAVGDGARRPTPSGYEMQRDGGPWVAIEPQLIEDDLLAYMDRDAASGQLQVTAFVDTHPVLWDAFFRSEVAVTQPALSSYRVRAVASGVAGEPSEASQARRRVGDVFSYQWQRSNSGEEEDYDDLAFQTRSAGFDETAADEFIRYYRVKVRTAGAEGVSPGVLTEGDTFDQIAAFSEFNCGVRSSDGKRRCWGGANDWGQAPIEPSEDSFDHITVGEGFGCGIRRGDRKRICWGRNDLGQAPPEPSEQSWLTIDATFTYGCGVRADDGQIDCWGSLQNSQRPPLSVTETYEQVAVGMTHVCAIRTSDQRVDCWGDNLRGEAPPGPSEHAFLQISAGRQHTCGVRVDDQLPVCWGTNLYGEGRAPAVPVTRVDLGHMHSCAIRRDDAKIVCWGGVPEHRASLPVSPSVHPYRQTAGGFNHKCAIRREDGRVTCWGGVNNEGGQAPMPFVP